MRGRHFLFKGEHSLHLWIMWKNPLAQSQTNEPSMGVQSYFSYGPLTVSEFLIVEQLATMDTTLATNATTTRRTYR